MAFDLDKIKNLSAGKTSFLQAGLWPEMEKRKLRCVYVKFSDMACSHPELIGKEKESEDDNDR